MLWPGARGNAGDWLGLRFRGLLIITVVCAVAFLPKGFTSLVVPAEGSEAGLESWHMT